MLFPLGVDYPYSVVRLPQVRPCYVKMKAIKQNRQNYIENVAPFLDNKSIYIPEDLDE